MKQKGVKVRAIKKTYIQFGLVSIPIRLATLKEQEPIHFNNLCPNCKQKISYKRYCLNCNKEIDYKEMLKGYYISKSLGYRVFTQEEIARLKAIEENGIEIVGFIQNEDIPFYLVDTIYNIEPDGLEKNFVLFRKALELSGLTAIGKMVFRSREYIITIKAYQGRLFLSKLIYPHRLKLSEKVEAKITEEEQNLALELVSKMKTTFGNLSSNGFTRDTLLERFNDLLRGNLIPTKTQVKEFKDLQNALIESIKKVDKK